MESSSDAAGFFAGYTFRYSATPMVFFNGVPSAAVPNGTLNVVRVYWTVGGGGWEVSG